MLAFNVAGMAVVGAEIGGRLSERMSGQWTPTSRTALGVVVPGAIIAFLWAIGGCLGFFGSMGALLLGSFGVGAILVKVLNLGSQSAAVPSPAGGPAGEAPIPPGEGASAPDTGTAQPSVAEPAAAVVETSSVVTSVVETPASELASSEPAASEPAASEPPASETTAAQAEQWWVSASGVQESAAAPAAASTPPAGQVDPEIVQAGDLAQADFTRIEGIGPKLSQRLHAANVHTFADLAALPPETAAGVLGWTSERLLRARILEQAKELAA